MNFSLIISEIPFLRLGCMGWDQSQTNALPLVALFVLKALFSTITALLSLLSKLAGAVVCYSGLFFMTRTHVSAAARSVGFLGLIHWTARCSERENVWPSCLDLKQLWKNSTAAKPSEGDLRCQRGPHQLGFFPLLVFFPSLLLGYPPEVPSQRTLEHKFWGQSLFPRKTEFLAGAILASRIQNGIFEMGAPPAKLAVQIPLLVGGILAAQVGHRGSLFKV